jgi:hypothetical protein
MTNLQEVLDQVVETATRLNNSRFTMEETSDLAKAVLQLSEVVKELLLAPRS